MYIDVGIEATACTHSADTIRCEYSAIFNLLLVKSEVHVLRNLTDIGWASAAIG